MSFNNEQRLACDIYNLIGTDNVSRLEFVRSYKDILVKMQKYGEWYEERMPLSRIESSTDPDRLMHDVVVRLSERAEKDKKIGEDFMSRLYEG